jgi:hypothetical protein
MIQKAFETAKGVGNGPIHMGSIPPAPIFPAPALSAPTLSAPILSGRVVSRARLTQAETDSMQALLARNFSGVDARTFHADLAEKNWVVLLQDERGEVRGFSTLLMYSSFACGRPLTLVCSGDTIVDPAAWGSPVLPRTWIRAVYDLRRGYPEGELYWLLLTSGFRTYRFMSVFCRDFHPRYDSPGSPETRRMLDVLGEERYGNLFDKRTGLVRFPRPQALRERLSGVPEGRYADPHVRFFTERNPGHLAGDELVSLASLERENLTPAGRRMIR